MKQATKKFVRKIPKKFVRWVPLVFILYSLVGVLSYLTNPFTRYTLVRVPFQTVVNADGQLATVNESALRLRTSRFYGLFAFLKSGYHIVANVYGGGKSSTADTVNQVIFDIHKLRFDPNEPYLISGDHFSMLYNRSLGIFYHTLLDPRTALDDEDWLNRQKIYLQTTTYALDVYKESPTLSTTIVPVGEYSVALMNIYAQPSDTLYSLLYSLDVMQNVSTIQNTYPTKQLPKYQLQTQQAAKRLVEEYQDDLLRHYHHFRDTVVDPETQLVKKDILLSGTKDIAKRQSAFYDNVMVWKTDQLMQKLGLIPADVKGLNELKQRILTTYWNPEMGCFLEDQSDQAKEKLYYSSDWIVTLATGFLDPFNPEERKYYQSCVAYIQENKIDHPFGLKYQQDMRKDRLYSLVRFAAPEYGSTAIWSNWGMEYVKLLVLLYRTTGDDNYLIRAKEQLNSYTENIATYGCYPEVYAPDGKMYQNFLYKSVCQTGWVVTYEQAKLMVESEL